MKKILTIFVLCFLLVSIVACQTETTTSSSSTTSSQTSETSTTSTTLPTTTTTSKTTKTFLTNIGAVQYPGSYCDDLTVDEAFLQDLLQHLTLQEKVGQMLQAERNGASNDDVRQYNLGSVLSGGGSSPSTNQAYSWYLMYRGYQNAAMQSSSGIPILYGIDAVHGNNNVYNATIFPHNIGLGAANDPDLMRRIGTVVAREVRVTGINYTFAPAVSIVQNIAWGRTYESFSESEAIVSNLTQPYLEGLRSYCIATSAKHFVADGATQGGQDQGNVVMTEAQIRAIHLKPYFEAINAGVETIMISYSSINGMKMHGSSYWITDVLKTEMNFQGFVISDYNAIHQLPGSYYQQVVTAVNAGIDMLMEPFNWKDAYQHIITAVQNGDISIHRINDAVYRILRIKYLRGLFHESFINQQTGEYYRIPYEDGFYTFENRAVAREAVRKSLVLLKNENQALPLSKHDSIAVLGEGARNLGLQSGGWTISWQGSDDRNLIRGSTLFQGLRGVLSSNGKDLYESMDEADTVLIVLSEKPYAEYQGDNGNPTLTGTTAHAGNQALLEQAMIAKSLGKTVIGVLYSGRPMILDPYLEFFDAFVAAWLPGSEAGMGIADVLFGDYNFTAKLPVSWPRNQAGVGMNINRQDYQASVILFPFGFGLTYRED